MRVTVIDYKAGNLTSVLKALRHLGAETDCDRRRPGAGGIGGAHCAAGRGPLCGDGAAGCDWPDARDSRGDCARRAVSRHLRGDAVALCGIERSAGAAGAWAFCGSRARALPRARKRFRTWAGIRLKCGMARGCLRAWSRASLSTSRIPTKAPVTRGYRGVYAVH